MSEPAELLDRGIASVVGVKKFFTEGWGEPDTLTWLVERTASFDEPRSIEVRWNGGHRRFDGLHLFRGSFESPDMRLPLPPESRTAYFELLLPDDAFEGELPAVCVHLAGNGDATYAGRRNLSAPLARNRGIGAMILMNPFYGERSPRGQFGTHLRTVVDQFTQCVAMVEEARSMVRWLREEGYAPVGLTGYSMGGYMAALAAQELSDPLPVIPCAAGDSTAAPLVRSPLSRICNWTKLDAQLGEEGAGRELMGRLLDGLAVSEVGRLSHPEFAVLVGSIRDAFVPPSQVMRLHRHWSGSELRWMDAGHTTGWALHGAEMREAVADAFARFRHRTTGDERRRSAAE